MQWYRGRWRSDTSARSAARTTAGKPPAPYASVMAWRSESGSGAGPGPSSGGSGRSSRGGVSDIETNSAQPMGTPRSWNRRARRSTYQAATSASRSLRMSRSDTAREAPSLHSE